MQITRFTDIGLRITMLLAAEKYTHGVTTHYLAEKLGCSYAHSTKVIAALQEIGVIETKRGRSGGVLLKANADSMPIGHIARALEKYESPTEGIQGTMCPTCPACNLKEALIQAQEAFFHVLDSYTVRELLPALHKIPPADSAIELLPLI